MKKSICIILAAILLLSFTACGKQSDSDGQNPVMNFVGEYTYAKANALVEAEGTDTAVITIEWADTARTFSKWVMSGKLDPETGSMAYTNCTKTYLTYNDAGEVISEETLYENGSGTVTFGENNTFTWHDGTEEGEDVVFEWVSKN